MPNYTGIEIGNNRIKFAVCDGPSIRQVVAADLPDNLVREGVVLSPEAMTDFIRETVKAHKIRTGPCALVLPDAVAFTRTVTMPVIGVAELELNLPYEFRDFITREKEKYLYDYAVLEMRRDPEGDFTEMDLLAAATLRSTVQEYTYLLRRAGFKLKIAAPEAFAYSNLLRWYTAAHPDSAGQEYCIIDLGHTYTRVSMFVEHRFKASRNLDLASRSVDAAIADVCHIDEHLARLQKVSNHNDVCQLDRCREVYRALAVEILRAINFYRFNNPGSNLTTAYYCGGGAQLPLLLAAIRDAIGLELESIEVLMPPGAREGGAAMLCPAAVGVTLQ